MDLVVKHIRTFVVSAWGKFIYGFWVICYTLINESYYFA